MNCRIEIGDAVEVLRTLDAESVHCCVTSPPYYGLRDYGHAGQIGLEATPELYVSRLVDVFREVRRVLRRDGVLWLNLGDSYAGSGKGVWNASEERKKNVKETYRPSVPSVPSVPPPGLKRKDLIGIPWMTAFALRADGWWLRRDIIWNKPNAMTESCTDRPAIAHEYVFLLSQSEDYWFDHEAIKEPASDAMMLEIEQGYDGLGLKDYEGAGVQNPSDVKSRIIANARKRADRFGGNKHNGDTTQHSDGSIYTGRPMVNKRTVWTIPTKPYRGAHFATMPPALVQPCIRAGCPMDGTVLDPFAGSGTTGMVAIQEGRNAILIELNPEYRPLIEARVHVTPAML